MTEDFDLDALIFGIKVCAKCGKEKAANSEQFGRDKWQEDGLTHACRECRNKTGRRVKVRHE